MGALTPGPEDAEKEYNGAGNLANSTHSPRLSVRPRGRHRPAKVLEIGEGTSGLHGLQCTRGTFR
jgi:hypothetical protein